MSKDKVMEYTRMFCSGCSNTQGDNLPASDCEECLEAFARAVDNLYKPKPSTDFTTPKDNPHRSYLFWWDFSGSWLKGYYSWGGYLVVDDEIVEAVWEPTYTHWLPMPDAPDT